MLPVLHVPDERLLRTARPVVLGEDVRELADEMTSVLAAEQALGLAAPQIGVGLRMIVARDHPGLAPYVLVNPVITSRSRATAIGQERCLSLPGRFLEGSRARVVTVTATMVSGTAIKVRSHGKLARVLQHEIDHLDGVLISESGRAR